MPEGRIVGPATARPVAARKRRRFIREALELCVIKSKVIRLKLTKHARIKFEQRKHAANAEEL
jgi:hypothetical protein